MRLNLKSILERQLLPTRMEWSPEHVCRLSEPCHKTKIIWKCKTKCGEKVWRTKGLTDGQQKVIPKCLPCYAGDTKSVTVLAVVWLNKITVHCTAWLNLCNLKFDLLVWSNNIPVTVLVVYPNPPCTPIRHWLNISHHIIDFCFFLYGNGYIYLFLTFKRRIFKKIYQKVSFLVPVAGRGRWRIGVHHQ